MKRLVRVELIVEKKIQLSRSGIRCFYGGCDSMHGKLEKASMHVSIFKIIG